MKKVVLYLLLAAMVLFSGGTQIAKAEGMMVDYVALGDSLATGHTPYGEKTGRGFTDIIGERLSKEGVLSSFTKEYATPGETSAGLLETLKRTDVQQSLKNAELITIISGANDFIDEMYNPIDETIHADLTKAITLLNTVAGNLSSAIQKVKALNPEADIYLFGYYFPLPQLQDVTTKQQLQLAFTIMNGRLAEVAKNEGVHFVDVASVFDVKGAAYLENPKDIHPNEAGYQVLADQFFTYYSPPINGPFPSLFGEWNTKFDHKQVVEANKSWTINLNNNVRPESIQGAIYVVKDGTQLINVGKEISKSKPNQIIITPPKQGYKSGSYQLIIMNDLTDTSGKSLKTKALINFTVK